MLVLASSSKFSVFLKMLERNGKSIVHSQKLFNHHSFSTHFGFLKEMSKNTNNNEVFKLVLALTSENRDEALAELSKKREMYPDLAPILWFSVGTVRYVFFDRSRARCV